MGRGNIVMKVEGGEQLRKALQAKEREFLEEMAATLPEEGQKLMSAAAAAAPRASGELAGSASVTMAKTRKGSRIRVAAAFLDEKAAAVHEGVHWGHHIEGTRGFKWYERVFHSFEGGFVERIAAKLRRLVS